MKKMTACFILFMVSLCSFASTIDVKKEETLQHGGARSADVYVTVELDGDQILVEVTNYSGDVCVFLLNENGEEVKCEGCQVAGIGGVHVNMVGCNAGSYTLRILMEDAAYWGDFYYAE